MHSPPARSRPQLLRIVAVALAAPILAAAPASADTPASVEGRVLVAFKPGADSGDRAQARADADTTLQTVLGRRSFQALSVEKGQSVGDAVDELKSDPSVLAASSDAIQPLLALPNESLFTNNILWGLRNTAVPGVGGYRGTPIAGADISAAAAWDRTVGSTSTVIADLDSGYAFEHQDLKNQAWKNTDETAGDGVDNDNNGKVDDTAGWDFVGTNTDADTLMGDPNTEDQDLFQGGHGAHTAGTIAAEGNNGVGITGVSQKAQIMPLRVCGVGEEGPGTDGGCPLSAQIDAINYAGANGARAANMSLGGPLTSNQANVLTQALQANPQLLVVAAAGNENANNDATPSYPCNAKPAGVDNVICVAATDQRDELATEDATHPNGFSNYGATSVDLGAPGTEIYSTVTKLGTEEDFEGDGFEKWTSGTGGGFESDGNDQDGYTIVADPPAGETRESTSPAQTVASSATVCGVALRVAALPGGGHLTVDLLNAETNNVVGSMIPSAIGSAAFDGVNGVAGKDLKLRVRFTRETGQSGGGVSIDDVNVSCYTPFAGYEFQQGTSMAAPHVTGAAGLLFSLKPSATVTEVRNALLTSVDARPTLQGKTTTGGRLNVARALEALVPTPSNPPANPGGEGTNPVGGGAPPAGSKPASAVTFSLASAPGSRTADSKGRFSYTFTARGSGAGSIEFSTTQAGVASLSKKKKAKAKKVVLATKRFSATPAGKVTVTVKLSPKALRALKNAKRLEVTAKVTIGGRSATKALTLKAPKAKAKKKKR